MSTQFALFDTAIGACAIAWSEAGIVALQLPEADRERTRARLVRRWPDACEAAPPPAVAAAIDTVVTLVSGTAPDRIAADLEAIALDLEDVPAFDRKVHAVARTIAPGKTLTYGEVAARIGEPGAAREVGQALGRNRIPIIVPCHRVVAAGGGTGGF
jgi:methylated-DNA-[protein]-cysteine S-methyltransferase